MLNQPSPKPNPFPLFYNIFFFYHLFFGKHVASLPPSCHFGVLSTTSSGLITMKALLFAALCTGMFLSSYFPHHFSSIHFLFSTFPRLIKAKAQAQAHTHFCCSCGVRKLTAFRAAWTDPNHIQSTLRPSLRHSDTRAIGRCTSLAIIITCLSSPPLPHYVATVSLPVAVADRVSALSRAGASPPAVMSTRPTQFGTGGGHLQ